MLSFLRFNINCSFEIPGQFARKQWLRLDFFPVAQPYGNAREVLSKPKGFTQIQIAAAFLDFRNDLKWCTTAGMKHRVRSLVSDMTFNLVKYGHLGLSTRRNARLANGKDNYVTVPFEPPIAAGNDPN